MIYDENIQKVILNLISDPYSGDNCFYGHILAQCNICEDQSFEACAGIGFYDDEFYLYINPILFQKYNLSEQKAILIHEAMHIIFNHIQRGKDKNILLWNVATDITINQFIDNLPKNSIYPSTFNMDNEKYAEYYYVNMKDIMSNHHCLMKTNSHNLWSKSKDCINSDIQTTIAKNILNIAIAKTKGNIPYGINVILQYLHEPHKISWQKILKNIMNNSNKYYEISYKKPNRRFSHMLHIPGKTARFLPTVICIVDVSGSMKNKEILMGINEIKQICSIMQHKLYIIQVDTKVHDITKTDFKNYEFIRKAQGGTDLYPVIDYIKEHKLRYDLLIFITDGFFDFKDWKTIPKVPLFFLITSDYKIELPSKKSYQFQI